MGRVRINGGTDAFWTRVLPGRSGGSGLVVSWRRGISTLLIVTAIVAGGKSTDAAPRWMTGSLSARYTLQVTIDDSRRQIDVRETVDATNQTGAPLSSLVFNVAPRRLPGFQLGSIAVNGAATHPRLDDVVMELPLPSPLPPAQTVRVDLSFRETIPANGSLSYGASGDVIALGRWYPILAVYRADGWDRQHDRATGRPALLDPADYDVTIRADPQLVIAHTGTLVSHANGDWHLTASGVRGFALAASRRFQSASAEVAGTRVTVYTLPEDQTGSPALVDTVTQTLAWYAQHLGPYGAPSFELAEVPIRSTTERADTYPQLSFVAQSVLGGSTSPDERMVLIAREIGRQWLGGQVGNDEVRQPWLGRGLVMYLAYLYLKDRSPGDYLLRWNRLQTAARAAMAAEKHPLLDAGLPDLHPPGDLDNLLDPEAVSFLDELRAVMGIDAYWTFLRDYVATFHGQNATTRDFLALAERYAGHDQSGLYQKYFHPEAYQTTATPTPAGQLTPVQSPSPTPSAPPTATLAPTATLPLPSPTAARPTVVPRSTPTLVLATPNPREGRFDAASQVFGHAVQVLATGGGIGLALAAALTYLMARRR